MATSSLFRGTKQASGGRQGSCRPTAARTKPPSTTLHCVEQLEERMLLSGGSPVDSMGVYLPPRHNLIQRGGFLSAPTPGDPRQVALSYLADHASELGITPADVSQALVTDQYTDRDTGTTHIYLRQTYNGLEVANATLNINLTSDNRVINVGGGFVARLSAGAHGSIAPAPRITALQALRGAASGLSLSFATPPTVAHMLGGTTQSAVLHAADLSSDPIPARLHYVATPDGLDLAWNLILRTPDGDHWYNASVDASNGELVAATDWVEHASYNVFALPTENPDDGPRTILTDPYDLAASPFGWHDTNGAAGAEFTDTRGNNVSAQEDTDGNDSGGFRPSGGPTLNFNFPLDLTQDPSAYQSAAITQLFYVNNLLHDIHYHYGFTEAAGNFQVNNYGHGGLGNDAVQADVQDGSGHDNANFATPPDGLAPRMQMYVFWSDFPNRDADLDNGIVIHEYGHGVSNRLTGGPANANALNAQQSGGMGEGWSDWWALMFTQRASDTQNQPMPLGNYSLAQPPSGHGIRYYPYSYDMDINPHTFGDYNYNNEVHGGGELWASALWDMNWLLINRYGFNGNVATGYTGAGSAGNILALKLVMDALKLQPANPTFCEARDAILQADTVLSGSANQDLIWQSFARRGLGVSADCGPDANSLTITETFDLPPSDPIVIRQDPQQDTRIGPRSFEFTFSEPMNTTSFSLASDVVSFTGPGGVDLTPQLTGFTWLDSRTLHLDFHKQLTSGRYTLVIGPQILAADNGHAMDQDRDGNFGEATQDRYEATVSYFPGYTAAATDFESIDLVAGAPGVFSILDGVDDGTAAINLGTNTFTLFTTTYTGSSLFASDNGLLTFGSGNVSWVNSDLTFSPTQATIAPLWGNWTTAVDASDRILGKFQDTSGDGVADRLIIEWSQVRLGYFGFGTSDVTFQAILQLNTGLTPGKITFNFPDLDTGSSTFNEGNGTTVGVKDAGAQGNYRLLVSYNDFSTHKPLVGSGKAILIEQSRLWPYEASATTYESIDLVPGAPGVFSIVDFYDDEAATVNLGSNSFKFYGVTYTGANSLFASSNGLLSFGSAHELADNNDLTMAPSQRVIAPLWDDWRTDLNFNDQVLGKFQDNNGDGVSDRLIIEWNQVQHYPSSPSDVTFQAILQLNTGSAPGTITFNYPDLDTGDLYRNGADATVGIKDEGAQEDNRLLVSYLNGANPLIGSGKAIRIGLASSTSATIMDDGATGFSTSGQWNYVSSLGSGGHEGDYNYSAAGNGSDTATWSFVVTPGRYRISATWVPHANRATDAPYTILDGTTAMATVRINQELAPNDLTDAGTAWEDLGGAYAVTGNVLTVRLTDVANEYVIADAIRLERIGDLSLSPEIQVLQGTTDIPDNTGSVNFGGTSVGAPVTKTFTVKNVGTADLTLTNPISLPAGFTLASSFGATTLTPGTSTTFAVRFDAAAGSFSGQVSFANSDSDENPFNFNVSASAFSSTVMDDGDFGFSVAGSWTYVSGSSAGGGYQSDYNYSAAGSGADVASWTFSVTPGRYRVSATWVTHANRATDAPFTILDGTLTLATVPINQELTPNDLIDAGTAWEDLGGPYAITGNVLTVRLTDAANEYVIADAIRLERIGDLSLSPEIQVLQGTTDVPDNTGSVNFGSTSVGTPVTKTFTVKNVGTADLTLTNPISLPAGFTLASSFGATTLTPGTSTTFAVRFDAAAGSFGGQVSFANSDSDENPFNFNVSASASSSTVMDDGDPGFSVTGSWTYVSGSAAGGGYQSDYNYSAAGTGADIASWTFSVTPGRYRVSGTWITHANRATDAPFSILDGTVTLATVRINQELAPNDLIDAGTAWEDLGGPYAITGNVLTVRLTDAANEYVIADAIRLERVGALSLSPGIQAQQGTTDKPRDTFSVSFGGTTVVTESRDVANADAPRNVATIDPVGVPITSRDTIEVVDAVIGNWTQPLAGDPLPGPAPAHIFADDLIERLAVDLATA